MSKIKTTAMVLLLSSCALVLGCKRNGSGDESHGPDELLGLNDANIDVISVGAYNYTDYDIYDVFLLPPDKHDIRFAASASGSSAIPRDENEWSMAGGAGADLAWDYRWKLPRKFKIWWFRIVDKEAFSATGHKYDKYTMKETQPGAAWCEGQIDVVHGADRNRGSDLILHFYPDGHVEGDIEIVSGPVSRVDIRKRDELPVLTKKPCLKEVSNPYFGKKKPIAMH